MAARFDYPLGQFCAPVPSSNMALADTFAGIDFGTSNSGLALIEGDGATRFAEFSLLGAQTPSYRSLLFFEPEEQVPAQPVHYTAGVDAIEAYIEAMGDGRLIQSFKTHLTSLSLGKTQIGPHRIDLDQMVTLFLERLRSGAQHQFHAKVDRAVFGRPVHFVGASDEQANARAEQRLRDAAIAAGFQQVEFELEPIAAAFHYERALDRDQTALVADFGGGTSDFCVMRLGPSRHAQTSRLDDILATGGVGVAGDDIDGAIIDHVVAPQLGKGSSYREMGKVMPVPASYYHKLSRWHRLSFLKSERTRRELDRLHQHALEPAKLAGLCHIVEANQGFHLHKSVERAKIALSSADRTTFFYEDGPVRLEAEVTREAFEGWIAPSVTAIAQCLEQTLDRAGVEPQQIDRVFLAGGTAFVPAVRRVFVDRFGESKLCGGDELVSIASGLALRARQLWG